MQLNELGIKHGTDKSSLENNYLWQYEKYFLERTEVKKMVEIGLKRIGRWDTGHDMPSVDMWLEWFGSAHIYGFDVKRLSHKSDRVTFFRGNQGTMHDLVLFGNMVGTDIDLVLDDASHFPEHQLFSFLFFWSRIKKGGIYVIEDCMAAQQENYPREERIHAIIGPYIDGIRHDWCHGDVSGERSSLILYKD